MSFWNRCCGLWKNLRSQLSTDSVERCRWITIPSVRHSIAETEKDRLARAGEEAAADFLAAKGYSVLHRNVRFPEGELDIIAAYQKMLIIVEVKTRTTEKFGKPFESVSVHKQRRQVALANRFMTLCRLRAIPVRFDIISIVMPPNKPPQIEHVERAFLAQDL